MLAHDVLPAITVKTQRDERHSVRRAKGRDDRLMHTRDGLTLSNGLPHLSGQGLALRRPATRAPQRRHSPNS
jgi:hypothetical protein